MAHPLIFSDVFTYNKLNREFNQTAQDKRTYELFWKFYMGDHWASGEGYQGSMPVEGDENAVYIISNIKKKFTSRNVVKETVDRVLDTLLGKAPDWKIAERGKIKTPQEIRQERLEIIAAKKNALAIEITKTNGGSTPANPDSPSPIPKAEPTEQEAGIIAQRQVLISTAEQIISSVWGDIELSKIVREVFKQRLVKSKCSSRVFVPERFYDSEGIPQTEEDFLKAAAMIRSEAVVSQRGKVLDYEGDKISFVKLDKPDKKTTTHAIEFSFVEEGKTYVGTIIKGQAGLGTTSDIDSAVSLLEAQVDGEPGEISEFQKTIDKISKYAEVSQPLNLGGNLLAYEVQGAPFVTEQLVQNNMQLNLSLTMCGFALIEAGFNELALTNVELEKETVPDPKDSTKTIQRPKRLIRGGGVTQNFVGLKSIREDGSSTRLQPGVHYKNPSPIDTFDDAENLAYRNCLKEAKQLFVLTTGDSTTTGESRIQARQDFLKKCQEYKPELDKFGSWMLTTILHYVAELAGKPGHFDSLEVIFDSKVYAGELSVEEKRVVMDMISQKIISLETGMVLIGRDDPDVEKQLIELEAYEAAQRGQVLNPNNEDSNNNNNSGTVKKDDNNNNDGKNPNP